MIEGERERECKEHLCQSLKFINGSNNYKSKEKQRRTRRKHNKGRHLKTEKAEKREHRV